MNTTPISEWGTPRFVTSTPMRLVGYSEHFDEHTVNNIPALWKRFGAAIESIPHRTEHVVYGAMYNFDHEKGFDYLCSVQVAGDVPTPPGMHSLLVPANEYAVFSYPGHISAIRTVCSAIWSEWLPSSGYSPVRAPTLERYGPEFDPTTGLGGFEVWIAVQHK